MTDINQELNVLSEAANFTIADMAVWCDFGKGSMRLWMNEAKQPHPLRAEHLKKRIEQLRWALGNDDRLPMPLNTKQTEHSLYVKKVKLDVLKKFSKRDTSSGRV